MLSINRKVILKEQLQAALMMKKVSIRLFLFLSCLLGKLHVDFTNGDFQIFLDLEKLIRAGPPEPVNDMKKPEKTTVALFSLFRKISS